MRVVAEWEVGPAMALSPTMAVYSNYSVCQIFWASHYQHLNVQVVSMPFPPGRLVKLHSNYTNANAQVWEGLHYHLIAHLFTLASIHPPPTLPIPYPECNRMRKKLLVFLLYVMKVHIS